MTIWDLDPFRWTRGGEFRRLWKLMDDWSRSFRDVAFPPVNVRSDDEKVIVTAELPGMEPGDIEVLVQGGVLTLAGERKPDELGEGERGYGPFLRSLRIPDEVDPDKVEAAYRDGVLEIRLARSEAARPKQIEITSSQ